MAMHDVRVPHDQRTVIAAVAALAIAAAVVFALMFLLMRNVGAY